MGIGQRLILQLFFPSGSTLNVLDASVQVVWKGVHVRKDWAWDYRTGVSFVEIFQENMAEFKNFLVGLAQKPPYISQARG